MQDSAAETVPEEWQEYDWRGWFGILRAITTQKEYISICVPIVREGVGLTFMLLGAHPNRPNYIDMTNQLIRDFEQCFSSMGCQSYLSCIAGFPGCAQRCLSEAVNNAMCQIMDIFRILPLPIANEILHSVLPI